MRWHLSCLARHACMAFAPPARRGRASYSRRRREVTLETHAGGQQLSAADDRVPWESAAVARLAARACTSGGAGAPLLVEGPQGTVLAAVADDAVDNEVATRALQAAQAHSLEERLQRARSYVPGAPGSVDPPRAEAAGIAVPAAGPQSITFGAVYEYRDSTTGKPLVVASTSRAPENAFLEDARRHAGSAAAAAAAAKGAVAAEVVWAGVGQGPVGAREMDGIRDAVAAGRASRLHVHKLAGHKPYSRHGW